MTPVSPLKHKYPLRARDKLSICTDLYRLCVINISLIGSIGKRVPQVSRLQVKLRLQDSGMDSVVPQITLQAICHLFLKTLPFLVCFRERPPEMRYGMYLVDVVAQPFFKRLQVLVLIIVAWAMVSLVRCLPLTSCSFWHLLRKAPNAGVTGSFFVMLTLLIVKQ